MMTYLGHQTARKIVGGSNAPINAFDGQDFPTVPFYNGNPNGCCPSSAPGTAPATGGIGTTAG